MGYEMQKKQKKAISQGEIDKKYLDLVQALAIKYNVKVTEPTEMGLRDFMKNPALNAKADNAFDKSLRFFALSMKFDKKENQDILDNVFLLGAKQTSINSVVDALNAFWSGTNFGGIGKESSFRMIGTTVEEHADTLDVRVGMAFVQSAQPKRKIR